MGFGLDQKRDAMSVRFEELDYRPTPIGALSLRRRHDAKLGGDVYEIKLGEAFLMSSAFVVSEVALAERGLAGVRTDDTALDVVVGGLGLGHTAARVLDEARVGALRVVELMAPVIDWHRAGLVPLGQRIADDGRCTLVEADFFATALGDVGFDAESSQRQFDAVLLDIDHSPAFWLDPANATFYGVDGLRQMRRWLKPGGVFGLWSNEPPDDAFVGVLADAFDEAWAEDIRFDNPLQAVEAVQSVYFGRTAVRP